MWKNQLGEYDLGAVVVVAVLVVAVVPFGMDRFVFQLFAELRDMMSYPF